MKYVADLPVRKVPGVGKVFERQLKLILQVATCGELLAAAVQVRRAFQGKKARDFLLRIALGLSEEDVHAEEGAEVGDVSRKSLSNERTFHDESSPDELRDKLR